ncbi:hypothetical protein V8G54_013413 [Vigna mungo]|uniref:peptidylprolyl isomerase n=1 Tax=Vigna mungo TaxID=3915 RepID=A0AAQ3NW22_VIGMU
MAVGLITGTPTLGWPTDAQAANSVFSDLSVLISGPPIKDPGALLRYALPIDNKAIREVQKPLEDITESLKIAGVKALDSVERNVRQASRSLKQGKTLIVSGLAESKKEHGVEFLSKLEAGIDELELIVQDRNRDAVAPKQKELLQYVGGGWEFEDNSASSQIFWLLKESELTPSNANILDGRYAVFGYVTENEDYLADLKVGDVIESIQVVSGLDNLVNPSYKIAG